ncbi:hypothetical protein H0H81_004355 [Sphagnurus paluster]|uniref:Symplekin/Pta1 N-terminal domain-containing protein n=1 Tax=Sphagnurus paluster TaxID=117069 RepID=A0A9P7GM91_9AGAR|nr:hypothetical protein H0H81_004355 [Sphagnurus paluster]
MTRTPSTSRLTIWGVVVSESSAANPLGTVAQRERLIQFRRYADVRSLYVCGPGVKDVLTRTIASLELLEMASNAVDPLHTLQAALQVAPNSNEQANLLASLREHLESAPAPIPILVGTLTGLIVNAGDSLLKRWVIDLLHFAICRSTLSLEQRTQMASQTLDTMAQLIEDPNPAIVKVVIQTLTTVYPLLFRFLCTNRNNHAAWNILATCKARIIEFVWSPTTPLGVKLSAMKFAQKVILVQTRGVSDPRLQNKNDPNLAFCPADHPFIPVPQLENEGKKLLEGLITTLYSSQ